MKATIRTQGNQFTVAEGDELVVNRFPDAEEGQTIEIDEVLMLVDGKDVKVGTPTVSGAKVTAKLLENFKDRKIVVFKKKRRKGYQKRNGFRASRSRIQIEKIAS
jgi:large subunit ribosomal protein L21